MKKITFFFLLFLTLNNFTLSQQWTEQVSGVTVQLTSAFGTGNGNAWICGYSGTVLRTTNAGSIWQNVSGNGIPNTVQLVSMAGIDANNALTAGYIGTTTYVYRTTNSGANWSQVFIQANGFIDAVFMTTLTNGFMAGDPVNNRWSLWKTTNGGANWDSTGLYLPAANASEAGWNNSMFCYQNSIWIGTNNSRIYFSSNNGTNWIVQSTGTQVNSYAMWFYQNGQIEGAMGSDSLKLTTNGGTNWTIQQAIGTGNFGGITGAPLPVQNSINERIWYVRSDNKIYELLYNSGTVAYTAPGSGTYRHISQSNTSFYGPIWAVRTDGGISYLPNVVVLHLISSLVPKSFSLFQNYPNPFNPETKIRFAVAKFSNIKLTVYDAIGRKVTELIDQRLAPSTYEASWNGKDFSSGIFFFRLETDDFTETKKMMMVK